jgi:hypothetical protein
LGEGRGNTFIMLLKERRKGDCGNAINSKCSGISGGSYAGRPSVSESLWEKMIGKPCAGKPPARFDEGELEIEPSRQLRQLSTLLYCCFSGPINILPGHKVATTSKALVYKLNRNPCPNYFGIRCPKYSGISK